MEGAQPLLHQVVIVVASCITSDGARRLAAAVVHPDDDRAHGAGVRKAGIVAQVRVARHVSHLPLAPTRHPLVVVPGRLHLPQPGDPDEVEAERIRLSLDAPLEREVGRRRRAGSGRRVAHGCVPTQRA
ncbi:MAG: hypothetical protein ABS52_05915 [Gemmatimonadetes bacterium SCN 70-22]|nr:MAG: hypothetical protein ABS52_05915 [Gemmatimonadetes bacterium SCN 70-22]